jgi:phage repressor protein C with HTH and peptisase S24 domain
MEVKAFRIACGLFLDVSDTDRADLEKPGWALIPKGIPYSKNVFAARGIGTSMQPRIPDGSWLLFVPDTGGTRHFQIVLVEDVSKPGMNRYTLKKYFSIKKPSGENEDIYLLPLNRLEHAPIRLDREGDYYIRGRFVGRVEHIERVEPFRYEPIDEI